MTEKGYLSKLEAAEYTGLSRATIDRFKRSGELKYGKVGKKVFFRKKDLDAWLESKIVKK